MIESKKVLVITFSMSDDVISMDRFYKSQNIDGKVIHIPSSLTAGCGRAYQVDIKYKDYMKKILKENGIFFEGIYEIKI